MRRADPRISHRRPELSQHFLRDLNVARRIARRLSVPTSITLFDVGAGDGTLTQALAETDRPVIAVEKDERLYRQLVHRMSPYRNVRCLHADFLSLPLPAAPYAVISNVPYAITAAMMRKLLHAARPPDEALLILQREAAQKFAGTPRETQFSLLAKPYFEIEIFASMRSSDFLPPPRVNSVLLRLQPRPSPLVRARNTAAYETFIRTTFGHGAGEVSRALRAYLTSNQVRRLSHDLRFSRNAPGSQLTFQQWLAIFRFVEHECLGHDPTGVVAA